VTAQKTERLLNLVICLLSTRQFLSKEQIRAAIPQYAECPSTDAFDRMFERDKEEVRDMGIPLETGSNSAWFEDEVGYRVDMAAYALPEVSFEPDELAVLGLAARVWQQASLAGPASRALQKLKAAGVEPDDAGLAGVETRVRTSEPAFEALYAAVRDRRPVTFPYRAGRAGELVERHLDPWGIVSWHGRWYVVGHDRRREARRVFRLSRIAGPVRPVGAAGDVQVPEGVDFRSEVAVTLRDSPRETATVSVRPGSGVALRRRATEERRGLAAEGWDELTVGFADPESFAQEIVAYGPDVVVVQPAAVRDAVVRRLQSVLESV
jgi:proteasome accessory factor B